MQSLPGYASKSARRPVSASASLLALALLVHGASLTAGAVATHAAGSIEAPEIGTSVVILRRVTGTLGDDQRRLSKGVRVHLNELLETSTKGQAELRLDDDTKLALGPGASLRLDNYVIGSDASTTTIALNLLKGAFRFITGQNDSKSYRIDTPSATIGVSGTVFDVFVAPSGDTLVLLHEGEVEVCSKSRECRRHNAIGNLVHANVAGIVSSPIKWTNGLVARIGVQQAFPFVGRRLSIDPVRRLRHSQIIDTTVVQPTKKAGRVLKQGSKTVKRSARKVQRTIRKISPF